MTADRARVEAVRATLLRVADGLDALVASWTGEPSANAAALREAATWAPPGDEGLRAARAVKWEIDRPDTIRRVYVEEREQRDGSVLYAVTRMGDTLNHDGEWEYEPIPSSRDDAYTARCRFASLNEAASVYLAALAAVSPLPRTGSAE